MTSDLDQLTGPSRYSVTAPESPCCGAIPSNVSAADGRCNGTAPESAPPLLLPTVEQGDGSEVDRQICSAGDRIATILLSDTFFDSIYAHILSSPGKRVRTGLALASAQLIGSSDAVPRTDVLDIACAIEMLHESSLIHDDICDGSVLRRGAPSVPAAFGVRIAARAGFHLAGTALQLLARVIDDNPVAFEHVGEADGVTYLDQLSGLSFGQLAETLPPVVEVDALRRHYLLVAAAKTGTLFRLACAYGGTAGAVDHDRLRHLMSYCDQLALAFQIMDDVRDIEGGPSLGKDPGGDLARRVPTWPVIEWLDAHSEARELWVSEDTSSEELQTELIRSGATDAARNDALDAVAAAQRELEAFDPSPARDYLSALAWRVVSR